MSLGVSVCVRDTAYTTVAAQELFLTYTSNKEDHVHLWHSSLYVFSLH